LRLVWWNVEVPIAVIVTVYSPGVLPVHERVDVPGDWMVVWSKLQAMPLGGETARVTVPANPLRGATVMDEVPEPPTAIVEGETSPAEIVKSTT
jgi:hypothetical protein